MTSTTSRHPLLDDDAPPAPAASFAPRRITDWRQPVGGIAFGVALTSFLIGWYQIANTENEWQQLPYLASAGGLGVIALGVGLTLFVSVEHTRDREAIGDLVREIQRLSRKVDALEAAAQERE